MKKIAVRASLLALAAVFVSGDGVAQTVGPRITPFRLSAGNDVAAAGECVTAGTTNAAIFEFQACGAAIPDDVLDFTEFADALTTDASTEINVAAGHTLSVDLVGAGSTLTVEDGDAVRWTFSDAGALTGAAASAFATSGTASFTNAAGITLANTNSVVSPAAGTFDFTRSATGAVTVTCSDDNADCALIVTGGGIGTTTLGQATTQTQITGTDNNATGIQLGSTGALAVLAVDTTDAAPGIVVTGHANVTGNMDFGSDGADTLSALGDFDTDLRWDSGLAGGVDLSVEAPAAGVVGGSFDITGQAGGAALVGADGQPGGVVTLTGGAGTVLNGAGANDGSGGDLRLLGGPRGGATGTAVQGAVTVGTPTVGSTRTQDLLAVAGGLEVDGLVRGDAGATITGAAVNLNASSNFAVNIGTGTTNAAVSIGGGSNTVAIDAVGWDASATGALSGIDSLSGDDAANLIVSIPVSAGAATSTISLQVDGINGVQVAGTAVAGVVSTTTTTLGGAGVSAVTIGVGGDDDVSITDAQWSISALGAPNFLDDSLPIADLVAGAVAGNIMVTNAGATAYADVAVSGDATLAANGALTVATATALRANGANCAAGSAPLGVDTLGAVESCFDAEEEGNISTTVVTGNAAAAGNLLIGTGVNAAAWAAMSGDGTIGGTGILEVTQADALETNPADCVANQFANTIAANGDLSCSALTLASAQFANQGTTTTVLHGNAAGNPSFGAVTLTTDVTGTLPAANGGTGNATYAVGDLLYASGATTLTRLADVGVGSALISGGVGVAPSWGTPATATALAANGGNCAAGSGAGGVNASGVAEDCTAYLQLSGGTMAGALAANAGITFDQTTDTIGAHTAAGTYDMSTQILTNIGNAGTDFIAATGGLTLAGTLTLTNNTLTCTNCIGAGQITNVSRTINLPLSGFNDCTSSTPLDYTSGADTAPDFELGSGGATAGSLTIQWDTDDTDKICTTVMIPGDYASGPNIELAFVDTATNDHQHDADVIVQNLNGTTAEVVAQAASVVTNGSGGTQTTTVCDGSGTAGAIYTCNFSTPGVTSDRILVFSYARSASSEATTLFGAKFTYSATQ